MASRTSRNGRRRKGQNEASVYPLPGGGWRGALSQGSGLPRRYFRGRDAETVRRKIRNAQALLDGGMPLPDAVLTVEQCYNRWLDVKRDTLRRATLVNYEGTFRTYILPNLGKVPVVKLTPAQVSNLYSRLRRLKVGASALAHVHMYLNSMLKWALRMEIVRRAVTESVDAPRKPNSKMRSLDEDEARSLLAAGDSWQGTGHRLAPLVHVLLGCGLRIGEGAAFTWADVDEDKRRISVSKSLTERRGGLSVDAPKTAESIRTVPVPPGVLQVLSAHRRAMNEESLSRGEDWTAGDRPVFVTVRGTHLSPSNFSARVFKMLVKAAGIEGRLRLHDLRHTYASLALSRGASLAAVSKALGHSRISTTLDMYVSALPSDVDQLSEIMDASYG